MNTTPENQLPLEIAIEKGYFIIRILQTLQRGDDLSQVRTTIEQALSQGYRRIVITMNEKSFLYSEILARIVTLYKLITSNNGSLWIVQSNEKILFLLETLGLSDMIRIVPSEKALPA